ncbi:L-amino acid N-acyltransferase YncA [Sphingomonas sp. F9_3S_D5_B_2]
MAVLIRLAAAADAAAIARIYRPFVETSRISFEEVAPDAAEIGRRMVDPLLPWLLLETDGKVLGYASTSPLRGRRAYRWSVESGLYLEQAAQGRGLGRQLLTAHLALLERQGFVTAVAGISLPNPASVALHEGLGFSPIGVERGVGFKLGEWVDVGRWQKDLAPRRSAPREPLPASVLG